MANCRIVASLMSAMTIARATDERYRTAVAGAGASTCKRAEHSGLMSVEPADADAGRWPARRLSDRRVSEYD
jgi:hypothetical protein